ncbi:MAG: cyclase [Richelia sp. RM2_1_2]|nr:cyclase [Richelia sp. SM2_1_7]NJM19696.1 cyclase [Richelia sp. SM1_7_0]NJN10997.1 cyclase [Richelia sp. RM1_1_1]NJO31036.1 cyclase [Richelia sp. SL_2_1]NJO61644.1 cyclase [Richelia sp. RM2_1_2]
MSASFFSDLFTTGSNMTWGQDKQAALLNGEILVETRSHNAWGGCVSAKMYLPLIRSQVWQHITDYPRWVQYFPDITKSEIIHKGEVKRLYQAAQKAFMMFTAKVDIYLNVVEDFGNKVQFKLDKGTFHDFSADIKLQDYGNGTLLTYSVEATPIIPIPSMFIQQAMNFELPANMRKMRQVLCKGM